ncbi:MAG TPA: Rrf2 family transcriptional regulator [bacterium]|jgi:Rrf2 family protein
MLRLTKKSEYGIIALKYMLNQPAGTVIRAKEISAAYHIPTEIMAKILQKLARRGIVRSCQGSKGGYVLAKDGSEISLSEIIETIDGPVKLVECMDDDRCACTQLNYCNISDPFKLIQSQFKQFLSRISLSDINNELEIQRVVWQ